MSAKSIMLAAVGAWLVVGGALSFVFDHNPGAAGGAAFLITCGVPLLAYNLARIFGARP